MKNALLLLGFLGVFLLSASAQANDEVMAISGFERGFNQGLIACQNAQQVSEDKLIFCEAEFGARFSGTTVSTTKTFSAMAKKRSDAILKAVSNCEGFESISLSVDCNELIENSIECREV